MAMAFSVFNMISSVFFILIGIAGIGFLIGFHEFGHFIFCKIFNIETPNFSIGMGPKIFTKKIGETNFSLSAIPLGGYVEIKGQEEGATNNDPHSFAHKPYYQKMLVIAGGIFFNLFFAYATLSFLYFIGMPKSPLLYPHNASTLVSSVEQNSPAAQAGLKAGDTIVAIHKQLLNNNPVELINFIKDKPNQVINITIAREGKEESIEVTTGERIIQNKAYGYLGIDFEIPTYGFIDAMYQGFKSTNIVIWQVFDTFKSMFTQRSIENVGGPLMVISQTIKGAEKGFKFFLLLLAFISINLAILNIIPLPIMDGGQALFYTIEAILRKPLPEYIKMYIHYACWLGIIALTIFLSVKDLMRIFWG